MRDESKIKENIKLHDKVSGKYEEIHHEIFNQIEQKRLSQTLSLALQNIDTDSETKLALDYGCGSGNLTNHLLNLGISTYAADVSSGFLKLVREKHAGSHLLKTIKINGKDLSNVDTGFFDIVLAYSVLHHIPDYLSAIKEMIRVLKKGGVLYLDHEKSESFWANDNNFIEFSNSISPYVSEKKTWRRFFKLSEYALYFHKKRNPRYQAEGDIHVWHDDHIEWVKIKNILKENNCEVLKFEDYLHYNGKYPENIYQNYKDKSKDMSFLIAIKK
jgi:ubiquinone/menaquinone biosynthesis C-methylase UbiE